MKILALDTETGGLKPWKNALLQIGLYDPDAASKFSLYVAPGAGLTVTSGAAKVNGWPESHAGKEILQEKEAVSRFVAYLQTRKPDFILCHKATFDAPFVAAALQRYLEEDNILPEFLCTKILAWQLSKLGGLPVGNFSLSSLIKELRPDYVRPIPHDAADDAYATWIVFEEMQKRFDRLAAMANQNATDSLAGKRPLQNSHRKHGWNRSSR